MAVVAAIAHDYGQMVGKAELPAWLQAIGGLGAVFVAIYIPIKQQQILQNQKKRETANRARALAIGLKSDLDSIDKQVLELRPRAFFRDQLLPTYGEEHRNQLKIIIPSQLDYALTSVEVFDDRAVLALHQLTHALLEHNHLVENKDIQLSELLPKLDSSVREIDNFLSESYRGIRKYLPS